MSKTVRSLITIFVCICMLAGLFAAAGCSVKKAKTLKDWPIEHELEFGGVYVKMTIDDFNKLGYKYGDSIDVVFSNGLEFKDIPYYNGYYTANNEPLLVAYPGYPYIKITLNTYGHLYPSEQKKIADLLNNLNTNGNAPVDNNKGTTE